MARQSWEPLGSPDCPGPVEAETGEFNLSKKRLTMEALQFRAVVSRDGARLISAIPSS